MRSKAGFKLYALLGLFSAALVSGACSDDDDDATGGGGKGGSAASGSAGKPSGGSSSSGSNAGGTENNAGSATAGKGGNPAAGSGGSSSAGTESTAGTSASGTGGEGGGGEPNVNGGEGGSMSGAAGMSGEAGMGGDGGGLPIVYATLVNPGFESGTNHVVPTGWTNEGTAGAAYYEYGGAHVGNGKLAHWTDWAVDPADYNARTYQTLDPIANGTYSFSIWVDRGDVHTAQYLFAKGHDSGNPDLQVTQDSTDANAPSGYFKITLSGIVVTSGKITVGVFTDNWAGNYIGFDDAEFVME